MVPRLSERTQAILFLAALGIAIAGLYGWVQASQAPPVQASAVTGVRLVVDGPGWTIAYGPVTTTNNTAFAILLEASHRLAFPVQWVNYTVPSGVFVTSINGTPNGQDGMSWQYWVGGVYGDRAASLYPLHDGDSVTWAFTTDQGGAA